MKPIMPADVHIGMTLPWPVFDRSGKLLLRAGEVIASEAFLNIVLARGHLRDPADERREQDEARQAEREARSVLARVNTMNTDLDQLQRELLQGGADHVEERFNKLVQRLSETAAIDQDALLAVLQIDLDDSDFVRRMLHAAALSDLMARALRVADDERQAVVAAALSFDLGLVAVQRGLNRQRGALSDHQRAVLQAHPIEAVAMLRRAGVANGPWLDAVAHHHERMDGSGYPHKLKGEALSVGARILAIADIYSAMVRPRAYRDAIHSRVALREIFLERGKLIDEKLAALFIKEMGVFPPGTLVRLKNNEVAVVAGRGESAAAPVLRCVILADGAPAPRPPLRDARLPEHGLVETVSWAKYRSALKNLHPLWEGRSDSGG